MKKKTKRDKALFLKEKKRRKAIKKRFKAALGAGETQIHRHIVVPGDVMTIMISGSGGGGGGSPKKRRPEIAYKGSDETFFMLAFNPTTFLNGRSGFFVELFGHRWEFYL